MHLPKLYFFSAVLFFAFFTSATYASSSAICRVPMLEGICCSQYSTDYLWPSGNGICCGGSPFPGVVFCPWTDLVPPGITVTSPLGGYHNAKNLSFNVTLDEAGSWCGYSVDGAPNVTMINYAGFSWGGQSPIASGTHTVRFFCKDTSGNINSTTATSFVFLPPAITFVLPNNATYISQAIYVNATLDEAGSWCGYSLDGAPNASMTNYAAYNWSRQVTVGDGYHSIRLFCNDTFGNTNSTVPRYFTVDTAPPSIVSVTPSPEPAMSGQNITFSVVCQDAVTGCNVTKINTSYASCNIAGSTGSCSIGTKFCDYSTYAYNVNATDNAGRSNTTVSGVFVVKKADGCPCILSEECFSGCTANVCGSLKPVTFSFESGIGNETLKVAVGRTYRTFFTVRNPNFISMESPIHLDSQNQMRGWTWFTGHRTDLNRRDMNLTLGPGEKMTLGIEVLGAKTGSYSFFVGPDNDYTKKYVSVPVMIYHARRGWFSSAPDISWVTLFMAVALGAAVISGKRE